MDYIIFRDTEVVMDTDADGLFMRIPLGLVISRIPKPERGTVYEDNDAVEQAYSAHLHGVNWKVWITLNFSQLTGRKKERAPGAYAGLLAALLKLKEKYGTEALNDALAKCWQPRHATIAYVSAILCNGKADRPNAAEAAWENVLNSIGNISACYAKTFEDPRIQPVIREMGGWDTFRMQTTRQIGMRKRDFIRYYATCVPDSRKPEPPAKPDRPVQQQIPQEQEVLQKRPVGKLVTGLFRQMPVAKQPPEKARQPPRKEYRTRRQMKPERQKLSVEDAIRQVIRANDERGMRIFETEYPDVYKAVKNGMADL